MTTTIIEIVVAMVMTEKLITFGITLAITYSNGTVIGLIVNIHKHLLVIAML